MNTWAELPKPCGAMRMVTLGAALETSVMLELLRASSMSPVSAVMASGVVCRFCERNWAVTMTSPTWAPLAALGGAAVAGWAKTGPAIAARPAATASERTETPPRKDLRIKANFGCALLMTHFPMPDGSVCSAPLCRPERRPNAFGFELRKRYARPSRQGPCHMVNSETITAGALKQA